MRFEFSKEIYSREAVLKAAYVYTDRAYLHIDADSDSYIVELTPRESMKAPTQKEFDNEVLAQMVRIDVQKRTKNVRELILARAFASSVVETKADNGEQEPKPADTRDDIDSILTDWFQEYE